MSIDLLLDQVYPKTESSRINAVGSGLFIYVFQPMDDREAIGFEIIPVVICYWCINSNGFDTLWSDNLIEYNFV